MVIELHCHDQEGMRLLQGKGFIFGRFCRLPEMAPTIDRFCAFPFRKKGDHLFICTKIFASYIVKHVFDYYCFWPLICIEGCI